MALSFQFSGKKKTGVIAGFFMGEV